MALWYVDEVFAFFGIEPRIAADFDKSAPFNDRWSFDQMAQWLIRQPSTLDYNRA